MFEALLAGDARVRGWLQPPGAPEVGSCDDAQCRRWVDAFLAAPPHSPWNRSAIAALLDDPRLALAGTALVATGQQPAVGGGPLYALVKAAHAVALAERLSRADRPVLPLFWCASEDHDLGECGHVDLIRRDGAVQRLAPDLGSGTAS
ncbi:MAG: bacillithiol biosynthesis BshC, partial [Planctomycetes bacterium]|nr:bacillithiol biosynthesis BshC [Planctomycetota bacterium]